MGKKKETDSAAILRTVKDILMLQALVLGVSQGEAASLAGVNTHRATRIGKLLKKVKHAEGRKPR